MAINKESITEQVYNLLREKIVNQEIKLGEQINPRDIAEGNGISVMPVRDALLRLANAGLVVNKPRVGFFVRSFSQREINNILEVRKMYELYCLDKYFLEIDREKIKILEDKFNVQDQELTRNYFNKYDTQLHCLIIKASQNQFLVERYIELVDYFSLLFRNLYSQRFTESNEEHSLLVEAILKQDKEQAVIILNRHLDRVNDELIN